MRSPFQYIQRQAIELTNFLPLPWAPGGFTLPLVMRMILQQRAQIFRSEVDLYRDLDVEAMGANGCQGGGQGEGG